MGLHRPGLVSKVRDSGRLPSPPLPASICHPLFAPPTHTLQIYGKMNLPRLQTEFYQMAKYICLSSQPLYVIQSLPDQPTFATRANIWQIYCKLYLSTLQNVFVQNANYICPKCKIYLSKLQNVFFQKANPPTNPPPPAEPIYIAYCIYANF